MLNFDAWAFDTLPYDEDADDALRPLRKSVTLSAEDIKFAFNAWTLVRLSWFFGCSRPFVMSNLASTQPTMDIAHGGNRLFYLHADVGVPFSKCESQRSCSVALDLSEAARSIFDKQLWELISKHSNIQLVCGNENGMSRCCAERCNCSMTIPQYGSIGSLSVMSAMGIAAHHVHSALRSPHTATFSPDSYSIPDDKNCSAAQPEMPERDTSVGSRPHAAHLLGLSDAGVRQYLKEQRRNLPLQLSVLWNNEIRDRNIGATMRNVNAFNCEKLVVLSRRKFNRRGSVGTHHYITTSYLSNVADALHELDGYEIWELHQHYPYLQNFYAPPPPPSDPSAERIWANCRKHKFIRAENISLELPTPVLPPVFADSNESIWAAVKEVASSGKRGIMLACPDEGSPLRPVIRQLCARTMFVVDPKRIAPSQRGLPGQVTTAIALHRLRAAINLLAKR